MTTTYSTDEDMMIGDLTYDADYRNTFRSRAKDEIDTALGFLYLIPLSPSPSVHVGLILKQIEARLASGRLILDRTAAMEDNSLQAYGNSLLKEGQQMLMQITTGMVELIGQTRVPSAATAGNAPVIIQGDTTSGVDAYYNWLNTPAWWL